VEVLSSAQPQLAISSTAFDRAELFDDWRRGSRDASPWGGATARRSGWPRSRRHQSTRITAGAATNENAPAIAGAFAFDRSRGITTTW